MKKLFALMALYGALALNGCKDKFDYTNVPEADVKMGTVQVEDLYINQSVAKMNILDMDNVNYVSRRFGKGIEIEKGDTTYRFFHMYVDTEKDFAYGNGGEIELSTGMFTSETFTTEKNAQGVVYVQVYPPNADTRVDYNVVQDDKNIAKVVNNTYKHYVWIMNSTLEGKTIEPTKDNLDYNSLDIIYDAVTK